MVVIGRADNLYLACAVQLYELGLSSTLGSLKEGKVLKETLPFIGPR